MVVKAGERCHPHQHLSHMGELALRSEGWESCPCLPPAATFGRTGPVFCLSGIVEPTPLAEVWVASPDTVNMEELFPLLIIPPHVVTGVEERCVLVLVIPAPSMPEAGGRSDPRAMKAELPHPLPPSLPRQGRRAHPGGEDKGELLG